MNRNSLAEEFRGTATAALAPRTEVVPMLPERNKRLKARLERHKAEQPPFLPAFDRVFVIPMEDEAAPDKTASGLYLPKTLKDEAGALMGLLVAAGPKAVEELYAHGIGIGDIVLVARFSIWHRKYINPKLRTPGVVMVLRASEIVGSVDLMTAHESGDLWLEMDVTEGTVQVATRDGARDRVDPPENDEGV